MEAMSQQHAMLSPLFVNADGKGLLCILSHTIILDQMASLVCPFTVNMIKMLPGIEEALKYTQCKCLNHPEFIVWMFCGSKPCHLFYAHFSIPLIIHYLLTCIIYLHLFIKNCHDITKHNLHITITHILHVAHGKFAVRSNKLLHCITVDCRNRGSNHFQWRQCCGTQFTLNVNYSKSFHIHKYKYSENVILILALKCCKPALSHTDTVIWTTRHHFLMHFISMLQCFETFFKWSVNTLYVMVKWHISTNVMCHSLSLYTLSVCMIYYLSHFKISWIKLHWSELQFINSFG